DARGKTTGPARRHVTDAYLHCAARLASQGDKAAALEVYRELAAPREPETVRIAALSGLVQTDSATAIPILTSGLNSPNRKLQTAAIALLSSIPGDRITGTLVRQFPKLQPPAQVEL